MLKKREDKINLDSAIKQKKYRGCKGCLRLN